MTAVSKQQRGSEKAKSRFIESHSKNLNNVSNLNMLRAKEIKDQFFEQRSIIKKKVEDRYQIMQVGQKELAP